MIMLSNRIKKELRSQGYSDTRKYRYQIFETGKRGYIARIELQKLDTTFAINEWEEVKGYEAVYNKRI